MCKYLLDLIGFNTDKPEDYYDQVWIQDLVKGGSHILRLKGASFWVFNAQICILPHSRDSFSLIFDIYFNTKS